MSEQREPSRLDPGSAHAWEIWLAWLFRLLIVATGVIHVLQGKYTYALLCAAVIALLVAPPLLARTSRANMPVELELVSLWAAVSDMTLGRLAGLYVGTAWFDKILHFGNSLLIGLLAFLIIYALQFTGRLRTSAIVNVLIIVLLSLGIGAVWEIAEYVADLAFKEGAQGSPIMGGLDDTIWDLILDGGGGMLGAFLGSFYLRWSKRTARRIEAFANLVPAPR